MNDIINLTSSIMPKVFVTMINFNGEKDTLSCLDSLEQLTVNNFDLNVIVIDNASNQKFRTTKTYQNFKLEVLRSENNLGFAGGQNLGIKRAFSREADFVLVLNNDVEVDKNLLIELLKTFSEKKDCGIVSPKIYFAKGFEFHKDRYNENEKGRVFWYAGGITDWKNVLAYHRGVDEVDEGQFNKLSLTDFASGCCMLIKTEVFDKVGYFDEKYFLYYEDNDLSQRAKIKGFTIYYQPKAIMWHSNAGSAGGSGSSLQDYYITRNRLLFGLKYASFRTKMALMRESAKLLVNGRKWQSIGVRDYYLKKFGEGSFK